MRVEPDTDVSVQAQSAPDPLERLTGRVALELAGPAPAAARVLCDEILARHGDAVRAVLFYGSCLRRQTDEGVLDFYVLVDRYRASYRSLYLRAVNALVPPNVFFLSYTPPARALPSLPPSSSGRPLPAAPGDSPATLRCKYAVISCSDFRRGVGPGSPYPYFWARFAQPALLVYARDEDDRRFAAECCAQSILTLVRRLVVFLPARGGRQRFSLAALWQEAFRRTYGTELRTESEDTIRGHYDADPERYDALGALALETLVLQGWLAEYSAVGRGCEVQMPPGRRRLARLRWHWERPLCKVLALLRLVKNATTFGDWVPYIQWKLERHMGRPLELSERQRRHPFVFGWPVLARLLWRREIR